MPLGLLLARWLGDRASAVGRTAIAILLGALLSFAMESAQQFLPARIASLSDLLANTLGTAIGAVLTRFMHGESLPWVLLMRRRDQWFRPGRLVDLGLIAIGLWTLSQLTPLVPSLDLGNLRHGLSPIWQTLQHPDRFNFTQWATYEFYITGLALLAMTLASPEQAVFARFFAFVTCVLLSKIVIVSRQLSLEAVLGALAALVLALPFLVLRQKAIAWASAAVHSGRIHHRRVGQRPRGRRPPVQLGTVRRATGEPADRHRLDPRGLVAGRSTGVLWRGSRARPPTPAPSPVGGRAGASASSPSASSGISSTYPGVTVTSPSYC